jgi:hypothetical protein
MNNWLVALLSDYAQLWVGVGNKENGNIEVLCYVVTHVEPGDFSGEFVLSVDHLIGEAYLQNEFWNSGISELKKFARQRGCYAIRTISNNLRVIRRLAQLGADCNYVRVTLEV